MPRTFKEGWDKKDPAGLFFPGFFIQPWGRGRGSGAEGGLPRTGQGGDVDRMCTGKWFYPWDPASAGSLDSGEKLWPQTGKRLKKAHSGRT